MSITRFNPLAYQPIDLGNPIDRDHGLAQGLKGWWLPFYGTTGGSKVIDVLNRNHGTLSGTADWVDAVPCPNYLSKAVRSTGSTAQVVCGSLSAMGVDTTGKLSFGGWLRPTAYGTDNSKVSTAIGMYVTLAGYHLSLGFNDASSTHLPKISTFGESPGQSTVAQPNNAWCHLLLTWDKTTLRCYTNGKFDYSVTPSTTNWTASDTFSFVHKVTGGSTWWGSTTDVVLWNRCLTANEITSFYNESRRGYPTMLRRLGERSLMGSLATVPTLPNYLGALYVPGRGPVNYLM